MGNMYKWAAVVVVALRNVPELYEIRMLYELPTVNVLETRPRLAAGAEGGGTTGPMSPSGASSRSRITGA